MHEILGISLSSSSGNSNLNLSLLGEDFNIRRIGTDGDIKEYRELIREYDGKVDVIGLGGFDRYYEKDGVKDHCYIMRQADKIALEAKTTPTVDGTMVKRVLEPRIIRYLQSKDIVDFTRCNTLLVSGVDRGGMAKTLAELCPNVIYGDLMFSLKIPIRITSYATLRLIAKLALPLICQLPLGWVYPLHKQDEIHPRYENLYRESDVILGDTHLIVKYLPPPESRALEGKIIVTQTVTEKIKQLFVERGARLLVTPMPAYQEKDSTNMRYLATNIWEGVFLMLIGKPLEEITVQDYENLLQKMAWEPCLTNLIK